MAKCQDCQQEMTDPNTGSCVYDIIKINNAFYHRSTYHFGEPAGRCNDCGIVHGKVHHWGCDVERCPKCGLQLISCSCVNEDNAGVFISKEIEGEEILMAAYPKYLEPVLCVQEIPKEQRNISGELYGVYDMGFSDFVRATNGVVLSRATIYAASRLMDATKRILYQKIEVGEHEPTQLEKAE